MENRYVADESYAKYRQKLERSKVSLFNKEREVKQKQFMEIVFEKPIALTAKSGDSRGPVDSLNRQHQQFNVKKATDIIARVTDDSHSYFAAHFSRALAYSALGNVPKAMDDYAVCSRVKPKCPEIYFNLASMKAQIGDLDGALADYNQAVSLDPQNRKFLHNRMQILRQQGNYIGAVNDVLQGRALSVGKRRHRGGGGPMLPAVANAQLRLHEKAGVAKRRVKIAKQRVSQCGTMSQAEWNSKLEFVSHYNQREEDSIAAVERREVIKRKQQEEVLGLVEAGELTNARALARSYGFPGMVESQLWDTVPEHRSNRHAEELVPAVRKMDYFATLPSSIIHDLCLTMRLERFKQNETVFKKNEFATACYIVYKGVVEYTCPKSAVAVDFPPSSRNNSTTSTATGFPPPLQRRTSAAAAALLGDTSGGASAGEDELVRTTLSAGHIFGNAELEHRGRPLRSGEAMCGTDVELLVLSKEEYRNVAEEQERLCTATKIKLLRECTVFKDWPGDKLNELASKSEIVSYQPGSRIIKAGEKCDALYVLAMGVCRAWRTMVVPSAAGLREMVSGLTSFGDANGDAPLEKLPMYWVISYDKAKRKTHPDGAKSRIFRMSKKKEEQRRQSLKPGKSKQKQKQKMQSKRPNTTGSSMRASKSTPAILSGSNNSNRYSPSFKPGTSRGRLNLGGQVDFGGSKSAINTEIKADTTMAMLARAEVFSELVLIDPFGTNESHVDAQTKVDVLVLTKQVLNEVEAPFQGNTLNLLQKSYSLHNPPEGKILEMHHATRNWKNQQSQVMKELARIGLGSKDYLTMCGR